MQTTQYNGDIIQGSKEGKRVLFSAGVHANEMNSYQTVNLVKGQKPMNRSISIGQSMVR